MDYGAVIVSSGPQRPVQAAPPIVWLRSGALFERIVEIPGFSGGSRLQWVAPRA